MHLGLNVVFFCGENSELVTTCTSNMACQPADCRWPSTSGVCADMHGLTFTFITPRICCELLEPQNHS